MEILCTWVGQQDFNAAVDNKSGPSHGPVRNALEARQFDRVLLLNNYEAKIGEGYLSWITEHSQSDIRLTQTDVSDPTDLAAIYKAVVDALENMLRELDETPELTFHLSPGTWAMAIVWTLLSETRFPAKLIQSSPEAGVKTVNLPFDVYAEMVGPADKRLAQLSQGSETWGDLEFRSSGMTRMLQKARKAAKRMVPVLIQGEAGTEKSSLARMIHDSGPRKAGPFITVNCSLISSDDIGGKLFERFADGKVTDIIKSAEQGTLYLEEIEALSIEDQARLENMLATGGGPVTRSGEVGPPDVRIIVSTGSDLLEAVSLGHFKESLFYFLAVLILKLPPLRERSGDLGSLIDALMDHINKENSDEPDFVAKTLSPAARSFLMQRSWLGNVRELQNTLMRACVWSESDQITEAEILDSVFAMPAAASMENDILGRPLNEGIKVQELLEEVAKHYIGRAIEHAGGNKTVAADLLGLPSYQTLSNWMKRYDVH